ncbi:MAG: nuclear transport factor 2 family protein [Solirubrobacterales bacterium]
MTDGESFEGARRVVFGIADALRRRDEAAARELLAEDMEHVTREGPKRGPDALIEFWRLQAERFNVTFELEGVFDAGDGKLVMLQTVTRRNPESGKVEMTAWPAAVIRVSNGKIVFLEGYQDRRQAFIDCGLQPD